MRRLFLERRRAEEEEEAAARAAAREPQPIPFTIQITSHYMAPGPHTSIILDCDIFLEITSSTTFVQLLQLFRDEAIERYAPQLEHYDGRGFRREVVAGRSRRFRAEVWFETQSEVLKVRERNWMEVTEWLKEGEKLTFYWRIDYIEYFGWLSLSDDTDQSQT